MSLRIPIHITVDTQARMFPFLLDGVGEDIAITIPDIIADIAMGGIQDGIVGGIRDGIGKRALALTSATFGWLIVLRHRSLIPLSCSNSLISPRTYSRASVSSFFPVW